MRQVRARLVSAETAVSGSGTSRSTHTARVERSDLVELERRGDAYEGRIVVPHALPPPLDFGDNKVVCAIEFSFYFGRGKPLSFLHTLAVHR